MSLEDICKAINILRKYSAVGIYNISSGEALLIQDIAKYISKKFNIKCKFKERKKTFLIGDANKLNKLGFVNNGNYYNYLDYIIQNNRS